MNAAQKPGLFPAAAVVEIVPSKLAHYVIRARQFPEMLAWYRKVFHLKTSFEAPVIAFLTYIAARPLDWWQRHIGSGFTFELAADGRAAKGTLDLELQRGRQGSTEVVETLRCRYHDDFVLTGDGWRFQLRSVVMAGGLIP